jgi:hypothetical protein
MYLFTATSARIILFLTLAISTLSNPLPSSFSEVEQRWAAGESDVRRLLWSSYVSSSNISSSTFLFFSQFIFITTTTTTLPSIATDISSA